MELTKEVKNLLELVNNKVNAQTSPAPAAKLTLPSKDLSLGELAELLSVLSKEYNTTLPHLIRKLDRVSGDVRALDRIYTQKDDKLEWTPEEDELLAKNTELDASETALRHQHHQVILQVEQAEADHGQR